MSPAVAVTFCVMMGPENVTTPSHTSVPVDASMSVSWTAGMPPMKPEHFGPSEHAASTQLPETTTQIANVRDGESPLPHRIDPNYGGTRDMAIWAAVTPCAADPKLVVRFAASPANDSPFHL